MRERTRINTTPELMDGNVFLPGPLRLELARAPVRNRKAQRTIPGKSDLRTRAKAQNLMSLETLEMLERSRERKQSKKERSVCVDGVPTPQVLIAKFVTAH
jgi:hypothetical protein